MDIISSANRLVSKIEPWKFTDTRDHLQVASQISYIVSKVSENISPIIPESSELIDQIIKGKKPLASKISGIFPRILNKKVSRG